MLSSPILACLLVLPIGSGQQAPDPPPPQNCAGQAAAATATCLGSVRGLLSPNPVDKALGAAAVPACLKQAHDAAACYGSQRPDLPQPR